MVNGYLSYTPPNFLNQYTNIPGMLFLIDPMHHGKPQGQDLDALKNFLYNQANVKYAIIHKDILEPTEYKHLFQFLQLDLNADEVYSDNETIIYKLWQRY